MEQSPINNSEKELKESPTKDQENFVLEEKKEIVQDNIQETSKTKEELPKPVQDNIDNPKDNVSDKKDVSDNVPDKNKSVYQNVIDKKDVIDKPKDNLKPVYDKKGYIPKELISKKYIVSDRTIAREIKKVLNRKPILTYEASPEEIGQKTKKFIKRRKKGFKEWFGKNFVWEVSIIWLEELGYKERRVEKPKPVEKKVVIQSVIDKPEKIKVKVNDKTFAETIKRALREQRKEFDKEREIILIRKKDLAEKFQERIKELKEEGKEKDNQRTAMAISLGSEQYKVKFLTEENKGVKAELRLLQSGDEIRTSYPKENEQS